GAERRASAGIPQALLAQAHRHRARGRAVRELARDGEHVRDRAGDRAGRRAMSPWLALAPLSFFVAYLAAALQNGTGADSLWMCHVSNLILAAGIAGRWPRVIGLAVCWIVVGIPLWLYDMVQAGEVTVVSVLSHLGGLAFGMYALRRVRISYNPWLPALVVYLVVQQLCRWFTPAELNVNLAHRAYEGWDRLP